MRHKNSGRKLGRNPSHRKALYRNLAKALVLNDRITTTLAKAKSLRGIVEPLVTLALKGDLPARQQAYEVLSDHKLVKRLFDEIAPRFAKGGGGYTRIVKLAVPRKGDSAPLAIIEFTVLDAKSAESEQKAEAKPAKVSKASGATKATKSTTKKAKTVDESSDNSSASENSVASEESKSEDK